MRTPVRLDSLHFHELVTHFLALPQQDRRLCFGRTMTDEAIIDHVGSIDFARDAVYAVVDPVLDIAGALHLASDGAHGAVLGLSVLPQARGAGIGTGLLRYAANLARERGTARLYVRDLARNDAIQRLARRAGVPVVTSHSGVNVALEHALAVGTVALGPKAAVALVDTALRAEPQAVGRPSGAPTPRRYELYT